MMGIVKAAGEILGYGAFAIALALAAYFLGRHDAAAECRAKELAARLQMVEADLEAARRAGRDAESKAADDAAMAADLQEKVSDYERELEAQSRQHDRELVAAVAAAVAQPEPADPAPAAPAPRNCALDARDVDALRGLQHGG